MPDLRRLTTSLGQALLHPATIFVTIFAVLALRSTNALLLPELAVEDGRDMLGLYFNSADPSAVLRHYNGYVFIVPNAMAWIATRGPVTAAPYLFTVASLGLAALGMFMISRPHFSWLIPDPGDRLIVALLLALLPLGKGPLIHNLAYSTWSLLFLLIVLLAYPLPRSPARLAFRTLAVGLCILSHPLSVVVLPICLVHVVLEKGLPQRLCAGLFVVTIGLYQVLGVDHAASIRMTSGSVALTGKLFLSRVVFETLSGPWIGPLLLSVAPRPVHLLGLMLLSLLFLLVVAGPSRARVTWAMALALLVALGIVLAAIWTRLTPSSLALAHLHSPQLQRYFYVPKLMFAVLFFSQLIPCVRRALSWRPLATRGWAVASLLTYLLAVNSNSAHLYQSSRAEGERVAAFLHGVHTHVLLAKAGLPHTSEWVLPRGGIWDVRLSVDSSLRER